MLGPISITDAPRRLKFSLRIRIGRLKEALSYSILVWLLVIYLSRMCVFHS